MLAKFLVVEEATSIAPHSTAKVKLKDAGTSNVGFIFPTVEFAARGLILANAGLLLGPAEARVYNTKDVNQNISAGECIVMNVQMEGEGLKGEGLEDTAASEAAAVETDASPENADEAEIVTDPNEVDGSEPAADGEESTEETSEVEGTPAENDSSEAESETDASLENAAASEAAATETNESSENPETEEPAKKTTRSRK